MWIWTVRIKKKKRSHLSFNSGLNCVCWILSPALAPVSKFYPIICAKWVSAPNKWCATWPNLLIAWKSNNDNHTCYVGRMWNVNLGSAISHQGELRWGARMKESVSVWSFSMRCVKIGRPEMWQDADEWLCRLINSSVSLLFTRALSMAFCVTLAFIYSRLGTQRKSMLCQELCEKSHVERTRQTRQIELYQLVC